MKRKLDQIGKQLARKSGQDFLGIFCYGSYNYGLEQDNSDLDVIILVEDGPTNFQFDTDYGIAKVYTLSSFAQRLRRGDLECYEILYSKYNILKSEFSVFWYDFIEAFSKVMSSQRILNSLILKIGEHFSWLKVIKFPSDGEYYNIKRAYWLMRAYEQYHVFSRTNDFKYSLIHKGEIFPQVKEIKTRKIMLSPLQIIELSKMVSDFLKQNVSQKTEWSIQEEEIVQKLIQINKKEVRE